MVLQDAAGLILAACVGTDADQGSAGTDAPVVVPGLFIGPAKLVSCVVIAGVVVIARFALKKVLDLVPQGAIFVRGRSLEVFLPDRRIARFHVAGPDESDLIGTEPSLLQVRDGVVSIFAPGKEGDDSLVDVAVGRDRSVS